MGLAAASFISADSCHIIAGWGCSGRRRRQLMCGGRRPSTENLPVSAVALGVALACLGPAIHC